MHSKTFKKSRIKLGLTQKALGDSIGLTQNMIAKIEASNTVVRRTTEYAFRFLVLAVYNHHLPYEEEDFLEQPLPTVQQKG